MGPRRVNVFRLSDGWRGLDMDEAKRRVKLAADATACEQHAAQAGEAGQGAGRAATHRASGAVIADVAG